MAYVLILVVGLVGFFSRGQSTAQGDRVDDCKETVEYFKQELKTANATIASLSAQKQINEKAREEVQVIQDSLQKKP